MDTKVDLQRYEIRLELGNEGSTARVPEIRKFHESVCQGSALDVNP